MTQTVINHESSTLEKFYFNSPNELLNAVDDIIRESDVVLDIGCGLRPMTYFHPKLHLLLEPCSEYVDLLSYRSQGDKSVIIIQQDALVFLKSLPNYSVDSIFMLDVIEHLEKDVGLNVLKECERIAREQIVIFTPLGFMPQHIEKNEQDAWGLSGGIYQVHQSGWLPEDFNLDWSHYICKEYHHHDAFNTPLTTPYGAFFAIKNIQVKSLESPKKISDLRIPFFSAYDSEKLHKNNIILNSKILELQNKINSLEIKNNSLEAQNSSLEIQNKIHEDSYNKLISSRSMRLIKLLKKIMNALLLKKYLT